MGHVRWTITQPSKGRDSYHTLMDELEDMGLREKDKAVRSHSRSQLSHKGWGAVTRGGRGEQAGTCLLGIQFRFVKRSRDSNGYLGPMFTAALFTTAKGRKQPRLGAQVKGSGEERKAGADARGGAVHPEKGF